MKDERSRFDKFAEWVAGHTARPWFFLACVAFVCSWAVTGPLFGFGETWQLVINTTTTIVTFLMLALLQNTEARNNEAQHFKLDAIADALADLMEESGETDLSKEHLARDVEELRKAVGLEQRISAGQEN